MGITGHTRREARNYRRTDECQTTARRAPGSPADPSPGPPPSRSDAHLPPAGRAFLDDLLRLQLLTPSAAGLFLQRARECAPEYITPEAVGEALVQAGLLTDYQLDRVLAGTTHGLVLGNHRVLSRLGAGSMGVVFLGEHLLMGRRVAIKVLPIEDDLPAAVLERFYAEMRVLADLHHPHIVTAFDAGKLPPSGHGMPGLLYLVMELVPGGDLEHYVIDRGPVAIGQACDWICQAACGLQEAHDRHLIHRDVKPSNLLLTGQDQVKVVDFGLVREFCSRLTDPRALLGTVEYMAPEQSHDPSAVRGEADIYGLGATLFWLLTGEPPYPLARNVGESLRTLQHGQPRRLRTLRPDAPAELETFIDRMLDHDPARRPALPVNVMNALLPFSASWPVSLAPLTLPSPPAPGGEGRVRGVAAREGEQQALPLSADGLDHSPLTTHHSPRVLIVDDVATIRLLSRSVLEALGCQCVEAGDGEAALAAVEEERYDLVLLDVNLPGIDGFAVCRRLRRRAPSPRLKVIIVSGRGDQNQLAEALTHGADDYIPKPFECAQLEAKVRHALRLKDVQDRADLLANQLLLTNRQLEHSLEARSADVCQAQNALLHTMARLAELRDGETAGHLRRLQCYTRCLADRVAGSADWEGLVTPQFLEQLELCVPLHDIGKIGLPDQVLGKPGPLDPAERALMETHALIGDRILEGLGREHGASLPFLGLASAVVRSHHERWDGQGYPDRLAGDAIPPVARLTALADVYDALRRQRYHKPAWPHAATARHLLTRSEGQFDPTVLRAFAACQRQFEQIYHEIRD